MALVPDIAATWRRPRRVAATKIATGREDLALAYLMLACLLIFVGQWPALQRRAVETGMELQPLIGAALLGWVFVAPLALYILAALSRLALRLAGRDVGGFPARMALFWALLAAVPLWLLNGLTAGMVGPGPALTLVGAVALGAFALFWGAGLAAALARTGPAGQGG